MKGSNKNISITPDIKKLDAFFNSKMQRDKLLEIANKLLPKISEKEPYAVQNIKLSELGENLPDLVGSLRVAVFFPNIETKVERHPNSDQFLFSLSGSGETRVYRNKKWKRDCYGDIITPASIKSRWHFVEKNIWHQSVATGETPWILAAIHTAKEVMDEYQE